MLNCQPQVSLFKQSHPLGARSLATYVVAGSHRLAKLVGTGTLAIFLAGVGNTVQAATLNWSDVWDSDETEYERTFLNVDGSGVDLTVNYSDNMYDGHLNLYDNGEPKLSERNHEHPLDIYDGTLRFTNDRNNSENNTYVQLDFSEAVDIDELWLGSLSVISSRREWVNVSAYSETGDLLVASKFGDYESFFGHTNGDYDSNADDPNFVDVSDDGFGNYTLKAMGNHYDDQFGRTFFSYEGVSTLIFEHYLTETDNDEQRSNRASSVALGSLVFDAAETPVDIPEPMTTISLLFVSTLGIGLFGKKQS